MLITSVSYTNVITDFKKRGVYSNNRGIINEDYYRFQKPRGLDKNSIGDRNDQIKQKNALPRKNASLALKHPLHQKKRNDYWKNEIFHTKNAFE
jgi:hypothetical protein